MKIRMGVNEDSDGSEWIRMGVNEDSDGSECS